jgi:hypothetical protein
MSDGFLGRWSRRKQEVREGLPVEDVLPVPPAQGALAEPALVRAPIQLAAATQDVAAPETAQVPLPTMQDVQALTRESDFKPFVARGVEPEVRNAAMKKLFSDPHFNVMDGLDTYIDDYSKPDPLPLAMLRKMASAQFLNLVEPEEKEAVAQPLPDNARPSAAAPAQPAASPEDVNHNPLAGTAPAVSPPLTTEQHAHTDLRLQQDHAAGPQRPGHGTQ